MFAASKTAKVASAAAPTDPQFNYVTMLLHGDGTNGAQNNTFLDSSTNNFAITRNGNTTQGTFTPYGSNWSNYFDGSGDTLSYASSGDAVNFTGAYTVECFFNLASNLTYIGAFANYIGGLLVAGSSGQTGGFSFFVGSSGSGTTVPTTLAIYTYGAGSPSSLTASSLSIPIGVWHHVVAVRDSSNVTSIFFNGTRVATSTISGTYASQPFEIGGDNNPAGAYNAWFPGYISNMRVVKGTAVYDPTQTTLTVPTAPLTAITNTSLLTCQSNRFIDNSTNNFTITKNGDVNVQRFSPFSPTSAYSTSVIGGSGYFDGSGDQLTIANNSAFDVGSGNFTVEAWAYLSSTSGSVVNYSNGQTQNSNFAWEIYQLSATSIQISIAQGTSQYIASSTSLVPNAWNHVAGVRNGNTLTVYVNGIAGGTTASVTGVTVNNPSGATVKVSGYNNSTNNITGYVADVRFVKGTAVYTANFTPPTAPLTAITNTSLLLSNTNAGILDNAMMNDLETVGNAQISTSVKKYGTGSLAFDGSGDWILSPTSQNLNLSSGDWTLEAWYYPTSYSVGNNVIVYLGTSSGDKIVIATIGVLGYLYYLLNGSVVISSTSAASLNTWSHFALVRNGSTTTLYLNGTSIGTTTSTPTSSSKSISLGADAGGAPYIGYMDDVRITKGVARYTATFTPPTAAFPNN